MNPNYTSLEKFFKYVSYGVALCGLFSLLAAGGVGVSLAAVFIGTLILAWFLEDTRWQISERVGVILIIFIIPFFYLDWKYHISGFSTRETIAAGNLSRLILILAAIKILQKKADRDWIFIYLISFFEVLLAAGLSISPLFLASLVLYLFFAVCSIIAFDIRKSSRKILAENRKESIAKSVKSSRFLETPLYRLSFASVTLLLLIMLAAVPLFFALPRLGGAGFGNNLGGLSGFTGFSDSVQLGEIGKLQQSDEVVMRVHIEKGDREKIKNFRWRGIALDSFDNHNWRKSRAQYTEPFIKTERDFFIVDAATDAGQVVAQTVYLEPIDTPVLFALSRPVAVQGNFQILTKDSEGSLAVPHFAPERTSYKVFSDTGLPNAERLRADTVQYSIQMQRYLKLPDEYDKRISNLAEQIIKESGAKNRYDRAKAIENYLQNNFGYTLELKAGGKEPLADFLFNVKEGHCEYFATAMAIMLRTQGVATRVVNGFQQGEYNETADVYVVRQRDAHSWVEVYFPKENAWIPFDPTPAAGKFGEQNPANAVSVFSKYVEVLETFWIQYIVSYDNQEQRSLFRSVKNSFSIYQAQTSDWLDEMRVRLSDWWQEARGEKGFETSAKAIAFGIGYVLAIVLGIVLVILLYKKILNLEFFERLKSYFRHEKNASIIEFYERMQKVLAKRGLRRAAHQTPLEFAFALKMPEAVKITERYNRVRFGEKNLSREESKEVENWLKTLEAAGENEQTRR